MLSLLSEGQALPLVWLFGAHSEADLPLGKALLRAALPLLVAAGVEEVVMDAGFLDGEWLHALHTQYRLRLVLWVREDMDFYQDALGQARLRNVLGPAREAHWQEAPLPKGKGEECPTQRQVLLCLQLDSWSSLGMPADALLVRDRFSDGRLRHQVSACIGHSETEPLALLQRWRARWAIEELYMVCDRYQKLGRLFPCREGCARAWVHFAFLAYTLLFLFDLWSRDHPAPLAVTRELLVIRESHYALIGLGQFAEIILDHHPLWQAKRQQVLTRLGRPPPV